MDYYEIFSAISLPLGIIILLLLVCRPLILWYFRIPDMIERQDELIREMRIQNEHMKKQLLPSDSVVASEDTKATVEGPPALERERKISFTELRYGKN